MRPTLRALAVGLVLAASGLAAGVAAVAQSNASETRIVDLGLKPGAKIPALGVTTSSGGAATFETLKGQNGMVLAFVRSADWCPFCKSQLKDLDKVAADLKAAGYPLVALSYDSPETLAKFSTSAKLSYTLVSDAGSKTIDAFGLRNTAMDGKARFAGVPHPAIYVIGADGTVRAKLMEEKYSQRPPSDLVLSTVKGLK
jgi:peroxiredoxin